MFERRIPTHRPPTHPGEILLEDFLKPLGLTQTRLAELIGVHYPRVNEIVNGKRGITPDTALRLSRLFGTTPEFWLNGQLECDLYAAIHSARAKEIRKIKPLKTAATSRAESARRLAALGGSQKALKPVRRRRAKKGS
jgi:addiction module HigA family antidote